MKSLELAGEAIMQSQEGSRLIAEAVWTAVNTAASRLGRHLARLLAKVPGPNLLTAEGYDSPTAPR